MKIDIIPTLHDNYSYIITNSNHPKDVILVDAGESAPLIDYLQNHELDLKYLLITHHHGDHTDGIKGLVAKYPQVEVITPNLFQERRMLEGFSDALISYKTPGHTLDHICYQIGDNLFTGDLLFHLGCGRVFEGTLEQTFLSLQTFNDLPDKTLIYPGHEYTRNNVEFCLYFFAGTELEEIYQELLNSLPLGSPSIPTTLAIQKKLNPFIAYNYKVFYKALSLSPSLKPLDFFIKLREEKDRY